ncbi:hypothetical protein IV203_028953 [Nitzschia inconspicua]|uniref:Uncharacterized protein n=1 Tax=Nitzschia inconspicua TaxID=303405 RepID=A0A9K3Q087_9STRA|nr:hypothetical protein IV203_028953 [Nitzschia inconspicua]
MADDEEPTMMEDEGGGRYVGYAHEGGVPCTHTRADGPCPWLLRNPTDNGKPTGRASSLEYYKKAISFFLPNSHPWVEMPGTPAHGNPTRSKLVNNLVAKVRLAETRREGKDTQATRPLEMIEYKAILSTFRATPGPILQMKVKNPLMVLYQWHLITRIDDVCNFKVSDPRPHPKWQSGPSALDRGDERSKFQPVCCRLWPNHTE